ncbi:hypothetical protein ACWGLG_43270 [Streptomyces antimycoticus]
MDETSTHTFTGDREALQEWLSQFSDYRIADVSFKDGSVLLYLDAAPFAVQGWSSAAVGQMLTTEVFPTTLPEVDSAAGGLAQLLDRGGMLEAVLQDADFARERGDAKTRGQLLKEATTIREEHREAARLFASHVAYDTRKGATFELPDRDTIVGRAAGMDDVPPAAWEAVTGVAGRTMTGTELADLVVEAARTALPDTSTDDAWRGRSSLGNRLRRHVLPTVIGRVLADTHEGSRNEALRAVANTRRCLPRDRGHRLSCGGGQRS